MKPQNKKPTHEFKIEGVGTVKTYGTISVEKVVKRLLRSEAITG